MQRLTLTVRPQHVEAALDRLLVTYPDGVHVIAEDEWTRLVVDRVDLGAERDRQVPDPWLLAPPTVEEVPDDWRERHRQRFVPRVYDGRLVVRPPWAPPAGGDLIDVVIADDAAAFGSGEHPTTRACLELLCRLEPEDGLADLGCGSGVLAIAAARLGWTGIHAVDVDLRSVRAAAANAERNGVVIATSALDLTHERPPWATVTLANVPVQVHHALATRVRSRTVVATGIEAPDLPEATEAYRRRGYRPVVAEEMVGWALLVLERTP